MRLVCQGQIDRGSRRSDGKCHKNLIGSEFISGVFGIVLFIACSSFGRRSLAIAGDLLGSGEGRDLTKLIIQYSAVLK
jgi:hypothetical protein